MQERWAAVEGVLRVRKEERELIGVRDAQQLRHPRWAKAKAYPARYDYSAEPFGVRRKEFWPLPKMGSLLNNFIPNLTHVSDGLIFQACHSWPPHVAEIMCTRSKKLSEKQHSGYWHGT